MEVALTRARFLELLGAGRLAEAQCEQLFVLGLFSMLDVALQVPLVEAIRPLRLPEVMNRALLQHSGPMGAFLALTEACERGNVEAVNQQAAAVGLSVAKVNACHFEALEWVARRSADQAAQAR
jgi:c-di-GMP phosphodiesterase